MKKIISILLVVALTAALSIAGTLAYLTDRDSKVNVFTVGDVEIELNESFNQGSALIPGVDIEKEPTITNIGKNDAWVWAEIAIPHALNNTASAANNAIHFNMSKESVADGQWNWWDGEDYSEDAYFIKSATIDGVDYDVYVVQYETALKPGETTAYPVIYKVYLDKFVDIDSNGDWHFVNGGDVTDIDWNSETDGEPKIYVSAYAAQTEGFDNVYAAYDAYQAQWDSNGIEWGTEPTIVSYEGVNYVTEGDEAQAVSMGGDTLYRGIFSDAKTTATSVKVGEGIVRLNNRALCKSPAITSVTLPSSLTYIDESVFQESGFTKIEVPENVTYIGKQAFGACGSLETIVINAKDVTIANYVARACANLKEVYINSDSVTFESGSMYFTNKENADASGITFYVKDQAMADTLYSAFSTSHSYGMLIKSIDGTTTYYNTLK